MKLEQRNGQLKAVEPMQDLHVYKGFIPWYRGMFDTDFGEKRLREVLTFANGLAKKTDAVSTRFTTMLLNSRPSIVVDAMISEGWGQDQISEYLSHHGVSIQQYGYYNESNRSTSFIRVVDGYIRKQNRAGITYIEPVIVDTLFQQSLNRNGGWLVFVGVKE